MSNSRQTFTIATWNVAGISSDTNLDILEEAIKFHNIDILCLQECNFYQFHLYNYQFIPNYNSLTNKNHDCHDYS